MSEAPQVIEGLRLRLRPVELDDAAYVFFLRTDPNYNRYLSAVTGSVSDQADWIERYKEREAAGLEYYFMIERSDDRSRCGLVRLYELRPPSITWGSWIIAANSPRKAALESANLSLGFAFGNLRAAIARVDVRSDNARAVSVYRRYGMQHSGGRTGELTFLYSAEQYSIDIEKHRHAVSINE